MESVQNYLISVVAASVVCGIVNSIMGKKGTAASVIKLVTGIFLSLTVISPLVQIRLTDLEYVTDSLALDASMAAAYGEDLSIQAMTSIIKSEAEAYILDKAASLGVELEVEVTLQDTDPYAPESVCLKGSASPYVKSQLTQYIAKQMGIPEEAQLWTG